MEILSENPRERIGGNFGPALDDDATPKGKREINEERLRRIGIAVTLASKRCAIAKKYVMEKRIGGDDGRFLRQWCITYAGGIGSPVWERALIFQLDRKQIGQEEQDFIAMCARNPDLERESDDLTSMCDYALAFDPETFLREGLTERAADTAARKAIKEARAAADLLEAPLKAKPKPKPKTEADLLIEKGQLARRNARINSEIEIARSVIAVGRAPNATKEQQREAAKHEKQLRDLLAQLDQT